ncbi:hypothetical protein CFOL_v3_19853 [Cephalotus follicularis]|uniref:Uncharacterized protein n=1 Tax=Cephalotus follicularis TaxID=3775 RepID=A0A1Q3C8I2_CEPFO|nr:hypothetical protein CFOL_v3_19853 [Cephalotus follicularis]
MKLSKSEKAIYKNHYKDDLAIYKAERKTDKVKEKTCQLNMRCSPWRFERAIKIITKVDAIKDIGFGGMLRVKQLRIRKGLCHWLLKRFNLTPCTMAINNRPVNVLEADGASIFSLNNGGMDVVTLGDYGTMSKMCQKLNLNVKGEIKVKILEEELITRAGVDDELKGKFILYCLGILLCPCMRESVDRKFVYSLTENAFASNINWGSVTI